MDDVVQYGLAKNICDLVIVGDLIDFPTLSRFEPRDIDTTVGEELDAAGEVLRQIVDRGFIVHWVRGNHEKRFFSTLKHQVDMTHLVQMMGLDATDITCYEGEELYVESGDQRWLLSHPSVYSSTPLSVARRLSEKMDCNVATAHNHQYAYGYAPNAKHQLLELGGLFDPTKLAYLWRGGLGTFPNQRTGFWALQQGQVVKP